MWVSLGLNHPNAWINSNEDYKEHPSVHSNAYFTALFFIVSTVTTVGYGDWTPSSNHELMFVMLLELLGLAIFSYIQGTLRSIEQGETATQIVNKKKSNIINFLNDINAANPNVELPPEVYRDSEKFLDVIYNYEVRYIFQSQDFNDQLIPSVRRNLAYQCLKNYYIKFKYFFYEPRLGFQAPEKFINDCLINIEPRVFMPGHRIFSRNEYMDHIYFIEKGSVIVKDYFDHKQIIRLEEGDFFGDYQILLEIRSNISYDVSEDEELVVFALKKEKFFEVPLYMTNLFL